MFNAEFHRHFSRSRVEDALRAGRQSNQRRVFDAPPVTIRHASAADLPSLERLAALDSRRVPSGELFVAEVGGQMLAATSIDTGAVIADPFEHTAAIVELLRVHSRAVSPAALQIATVEETTDELLPEAA